MIRDWKDFKSLHSNLSGAREAFEDTCENLFRRIYRGQPVSGVKVKQGDGGIDIFIGALGVEPITVVQCKFFLDGIGQSQRNQINQSFNTAITNTEFETKEWILCIPHTLTLDEHKWWFDWSKKQQQNHSLSSNQIHLKNGTELIDLLKEHNLYNQSFKIDDSIKIEALYEKIVKPKYTSEQIYNAKTILFNNYTVECEPYYIERTVDIQIKKILEVTNLWLHGFSGSGKTTAINRNLINSETRYYYCDLSATKITCSDDVFEDLLFAVEQQNMTDRSKLLPNKIKQLAELLVRCKVDKTVIAIDEFHIKSPQLSEDIVSDLLSLVVHHGNLAPKNNLNFVISTIFDPSIHFVNKSKANQYFQFIETGDWDSDIITLFDLLEKSFKLDLTRSKGEIINVAKNSPRLLKSIFRKIYYSGKQEHEDILEIISNGKAEMVL